MIWCWKVKHLVCFVSARCSYCLNRQLCLEEAARLASLSVFGRFRKPLGCIVISFVGLTWGILGFKGSQWVQAQQANAALNPVWGSLQQDTNVGVLTSRLYPKHFPFYMIYEASFRHLVYLESYHCIYLLLGDKATLVKEMILHLLEKLFMWEHFIITFPLSVTRAN